jgi:hypothetical protein
MAKMKAVAALLLASLAVGDFALAAERAAPSKTPECMTLEAFKAKGEKMASALEALAKAQGHDAPKTILPDAFAKVPASAYHFFMGVYVMNPTTPAGLPPGDGVLLATTKGKDGGTLLWTKGELVCGAPMQAPKALLDMVRKIKDAPGEDKDELRL